MLPLAERLSVSQAAALRRWKASRVCLCRGVRLHKDASRSDIWGLPTDSYRYDDRICALLDLRLA